MTNFFQNILLKNAYGSDKKSKITSAKLLVFCLTLLCATLCQAKNSTTIFRKTKSLASTTSAPLASAKDDPVVKILERGATEFDFDKSLVNATFLDDIGALLDDDSIDSVPNLPSNTGSFRVPKVDDRNDKSSRESATLSDGIETWTNGLTPELRRLLDAPSSMNDATGDETPHATPFGMVEPNFEESPPATDRSFVPYRGDATDPYLRPLKVQAEHQRLGRLLGELSHNSQLLTNSPHRNDRRSGYGLLHQRIFGDRRLGQHQNVVRRIIKTAKAPAAIGPYSQAVLTGNTLYISGQLGMSPEKGVIVKGGVRSETEQALKNMGEILKAVGASYNNVVKTTILLADMADFSVVNDVYKTFFKGHYPARATFQVAGLPKNGLVEIEAVAALGKLLDSDE